MRQVGVDNRGDLQGGIVYPRTVRPIVSGCLNGTQKPVSFAEVPGTRAESGEFATGRRVATEHARATHDAPSMRDIGA